MSWVLTILGIVALIVLHELGHFTVAKLVGMRVERFSLFFPPTIFKIKRGETEYAIGAIPAGGYVKITGMNPEELEDLDPEVTRRAYYSQPPWKRIAVILAGPGVNLLIAFALFWLVLFSGMRDGAISLGNLDPSLATVKSTPSVASVRRGAAAYGVLRAGDQLVAVEGKPANAEQAEQRISSHTCAGPQVEGCHAREPVALTVRRAGQTFNVSVYPRYDTTEKRMLVGFVFGFTAKPFSAPAAAGGAISAMWHATTETVAGLGRALTSSKTRGEVSSIVGITKDAHETVVAGAGYALVFLGYISLVLAVINLFPFLPLDGGHIVWSLAEKFRGKRISVGAMYRYSSVGLILLAFLVISGVSNDIGRLGG